MEKEAAKPNSEKRQLQRVLLIVLCLHLIVALLSWRGLIKDDADNYVNIGRNISLGNGYVTAVGRPLTAWRAPGYPYVLAGIFRLTGGSLGAARCVQAFLWTLTAYLTYLLGRRFLRHDTALIAAGLIGFYPEILGLSGILWSESVFVPLFLGAIYTVLCQRDSQKQGIETEREQGTGNREQKREDADAASIQNPKSKIQNGDVPKSKIQNPNGPQIGRAALAGVLIGFAILTRSTAIVLLPFVWFAAVKKGNTAASYLPAALTTVFAVAIMGCWTLRNMAVLGKPILVESNTGYNLYVGNRPDTPIPFAWRRADKLPDDPLYQSTIADRNEVERYTALSQIAITEIKTHPLHTLELAFGKTFDFWLPDFFIALNVKAGAFGPMYARAWPLVALVTISSYFVIMAAALRRGWATRRDWETKAISLILALYTLPHLLVYGASRYHLPLLPLIFLLAAPTLQEWAQNRRKRVIV